MSREIDPAVLAEELIKVYGGRDKAFQTFLADFHRMARLWDQDTLSMGRILRSHLFVEHYLTLYISARNPDLGPIDGARLTFTQKIALVNENDHRVSFLLPGIRRLNTIRNRIAHSLRVEVTTEDANVFLAIPLFRALRDAARAPLKASTDPLHLLEEFAQHAAGIFDAAVGKHHDLWKEAFQRANAKREAAEEANKIEGVPGETERNPQ